MSRASTFASLVVGSVIYAAVSDDPAAITCTVLFCGCALLAHYIGSKLQGKD